MTSPEIGPDGHPIPVHGRESGFYMLKKDSERFVRRCESIVDVLKYLLLFCSLVCVIPLPLRYSTRRQTLVRILETDKQKICEEWLRLLQQEIQSADSVHITLENLGETRIDCRVQCVNSCLANQSYLLFAD